MIAQSARLSTNDLWAAVDRQRSSTADLLGSLAPHEWQRPSLCADWTVKDVAGHLAWQRTSAFASSMPSMIGAMFKARGNLDRAISNLAIRWAQRRTPEELTAEVRGLVGHHRHPMSATNDEVLIDAIVHHQDIALALGRPLTGDPLAAAHAADRTWSQPARFTLPVTKQLAQFRWRATDTDWDNGDGPLIEGPMTAILTALLGRPAALDHLTGPGVAAAREVMASR